MNTYGYIKTAAISFDLKIADVTYNTQQILYKLDELDPDTRLAIFPELTLSGYTCGDLFYQKHLLDACIDALEILLKKNMSHAILAIGLPLLVDGKLYNCAALIHEHELLGIVPKTYLPNYNEFYEKRWFVSSTYRTCDHIRLFGKEIPFTPNIIIHDETTQANIAVDICEDLWVSVPPSVYHTQNCANIIINLSASNELIAKSKYRQDIIKIHSSKCICGYVYTSSDQSESNSDLLFSGHKLIVDNGTVISEDIFPNTCDILYGEIDIDKLNQDRMKFHTDMHLTTTPYYHIYIKTKKIEKMFQLTRHIDPYPFVPADDEKRSQRCLQILNIQASALAQRLKKIHTNKLVIGISGGLDSTLALLVAIKAFEINHYDTKGIISITMPGFGTTKRTKTNSHALMEALHTTIKEISIHDACLQHFKDIEHDPSALDITYENTQARERTQILMDIANKENGIVLGTGDLSELALGWCTYNGDHMSMYGVNASIPKTLVRYLVKTYSEEMRKIGRIDIADTLDDICDTPVSPELLPPKESGEIAQITEASIGSYDLHDFFIYHMLRNGYTPTKIYYLACIAFKDINHETIKQTLKTFYKRFFAQQFKRNCLPDGVKVGSICLSPRGDWRMPSDASSALWLKEVETL